MTRFAGPMTLGQPTGPARQQVLKPPRSSSPLGDEYGEIEYGGLPASVRCNVRQSNTALDNAVAFIVMPEFQRSNATPNARGGVRDAEKGNRAGLTRLGPRRRLNYFVGQAWEDNSRFTFRVDKAAFPTVTAFADEWLRPCGRRTNPDWVDDCGGGGRAQGLAAPMPDRRDENRAAHRWTSLCCGSDRWRRDQITELPCSAR